MIKKLRVPKGETVRFYVYSNSANHRPYIFSAAHDFDLKIGDVIRYRKKLSAFHIGPYAASEGEQTARECATGTAKISAISFSMVDGERYVECYETKVENKNPKSI